MLADVRAFAEDQGTDCLDEQTTTDADYGCLEERSYRRYDLLQYLEETPHWPGLKAFVHLTVTHEKDGKTNRTERFSLLSKKRQHRRPPASFGGIGRSKTACTLNLRTSQNLSPLLAGRKAVFENRRILRYLRIAGRVARANLKSCTRKLKSNFTHQTARIEVLRGAYLRAEHGECAPI